MQIHFVIDEEAKCKEQDGDDHHPEFRFVADRSTAFGCGFERA